MIKRKEILKNTTVFIISMFCTLLLIEGLLRLKNANQTNYTIEMWRYSKLLKKKSDDVLLGHEHQANKSATLQNTKIRLNSWGMRGPEFDLNDSLKKRILLLGSSQTLGWGVQEEKTMASILQENMNNQVQVFNAGIGNYNTQRYVHSFKNKWRDLNPDVVVVHYFINDVEKLEPGGGNFFLRNSQLAVMLNQVVQLMKHSSTEDPELVNYYKNIYQDNHQGWQEMHEALNQLNQLASEDSFSVILAVTPESHSLSSYPFMFVHEKMENIAKNFDWTFVDLTGPLQSTSQENLWVMRTDPHYNAKANQIMAKTLSPHLLKEINK